ncbi:ABC transporter substrate-binding protein [Pelomonas sp. SE-A7]|uniref:substrate-binding periplasmic protein n=1 Tax=Pelomonas sp. SE-A7 TaxID=3054953 RepID=UPI00259C8DA3|nr:ABC transporter substrate-binding protein [Pelomonas sp. SE-A7]MDM4765805.1 ABC transporter substrate-binding protein [Pelomonas sp. SE-A7]
MGVTTAVQAGPDELRFAVGQTWAMPFADLYEGKLRGGILYEFMQRVAVHAKAEPRYVLLPSKRVDAAMADGTVDLHCLLSPRWYVAVPPPERWSVPLLRIDDVLLVPPGRSTRPPDFSTLKNAGIGVVLGYRYPTLEEWFEGGQLHREQANSQEKVLEKLALGRTAYGVTNRYIADWFNKQRPPEQRVGIVKTVDSVQTHCLLGEKTGLPSARIHKAIREVVESGELAAILARYR